MREDKLFIIVLAIFNLWWNDVVIKECFSYKSEVKVNGVYEIMGICILVVSFYSFLENNKISHYYWKV